jgi:hypothetical protein
VKAVFAMGVMDAMDDGCMDALDALFAMDVMYVQ